MNNGTMTYNKHGIKVQHNDGGRAAAGYAGDTGDCVCRAIAIATGIDYQVVYDMINILGKKERKTKGKRSKSSARTGVYRGTIRKLMEELGWDWVPTMTIGSGCKVHLRPDELPEGRLVVSLSKHLTCVVDGIIHDTHDPSREGTRCVYGYWKKAAPAMTAFEVCRAMAKTLKHVKYCLETKQEMGQLTLDDVKKVLAMGSHLELDK